MMVFDKTGTLTEDGLQIKGIRGVFDSANIVFTRFVEKLHELIEDKEYGSQDKTCMLNQAMACCHAITYVNDELIGDPLEVKMFEMTDWILDEKNVGSNSLVQLDDLVLAYIKTPPMSSKKEELAIIKRFDFESKLQRMSVVVKDIQTSNYFAYVKGSPEMIQSLSD